MVIESIVQIRFIGWKMRARLVRSAYQAQFLRLQADDARSIIGRAFSESSPMLALWQRVTIHVGRKRYVKEQVFPDRSPDFNLITWQLVAPAPMSTRASLAAVTAVNAHTSS